ncbi:SpoIIE family protein phosphatase [Mycobacterium sp. TY814]|uniref:SpoIIE family protein phosphatase n=1 Tax=unclassified Mycobacterium TaxID=2642494 RepID=UPI00274278E6|nr:SpoIIE family protein phosphatase [Mycobacterium sp. TY814]MDP7721251.1 SpoIIE family protein phosphatase [Mycobacterium sp. TY814]
MLEDRHLDSRVGDPAVVRSVFEALDVMACCWQGPELRLIAANAAFRYVAGRDDVIGCTVSEVFPELDGQLMNPVIERVYSTGRTEVGREWRVQWEHPASNRVEERWLSFVVAPHTDNREWVLAYAIDVTDQVMERELAGRQAAEAQRRYEATRDVVDELQRALLPIELPVVPHIDLAARYLTASRDQAAGGDWFDALPLDDGRMALVVGDVVGHGVAASAAMGQLRAALELAVTTAADLGSAIAQVDAFAAQKRPLRAATVAIVVIDPRTADMEFCLCGHPPPVVVGADGNTRFLHQSGSAPLGVGHHHAVIRRSLKAGDVVLLYSDGLIERPGRTMADGYAEVAQVAADAVANRVLPTGAAVSPAARACQLTVELLTRTGYDDDVTTLAAQLVAAPPPELAVSTIADDHGITEAVDGIRTWLAALDISDEATLAIELAVNEAVANVAVHAYPDCAPGPLRISGVLRSGGVAEVCVGDDGQWRTPGIADIGRGRGLAMMERLLDEVTIKHDGAPRPAGKGTVLTLRHKVSRPALVASRSFGSSPSPAPPTYRAERNDEPGKATLTVTGAVDALTADRFNADLADAAQGGTVGLTVLLDQVTMLTSRGVRALFMTREQLAAHQRPFTLVAASGTPAAVVLDLVGLERTTE